MMICTRCTNDITYEEIRAEIYIGDNDPAEWNQEIDVICSDCYDRYLYPAIRPDSAVPDNLEVTSWKRFKKGVQGRPVYALLTILLNLNASLIREEAKGKSKSYWASIANLGRRIAYIKDLIEEMAKDAKARGEQPKAKLTRTAKRRMEI